MERWHQELIATIDGADSLELPKKRHTSVSAESAFDQVAVDALWTIICTRLLAMGIAPGILISRASLADWYLNDRKKDGRVLFDASDWRQDALGAWLEEFISGSRHLSVGWGEQGAVVHESDSVDQTPG